MPKSKPHILTYNNELDETKHSHPLFTYKSLKHPSSLERKLGCPRVGNHVSFGDGIL